MTEASGESRDKRRTHKVRGLASQLIHGATLRASRRAATWAAAALWRCCRDDRPASPCSSRCCSGSSAARSTLGTSGVWKHKNIRRWRVCPIKMVFLQWLNKPPLMMCCYELWDIFAPVSRLIYIISAQTFIRETDCRWLQFNSFYYEGSCRLSTTPKVV